MRRWLVVVLALIAALVLGVGLVARLILARDLEHFRGPVEAELSGALGREVRVGRLLRPGGILRPRLRATEVVVLDSHGASELARIDELEIGLELRPLLGGTLRIDSVQARGVTLALVSDAEGRPTWPVHVAASGGGVGVELALEQLDLDDAGVAYHDGVSGENLHAFVDDLHLALAGDGAVSLRSRGTFEEVPWRISGDLTRLAASDGSGFGLDLRGRVAEARVRARGTVVRPLEPAGVDLRVEVEAPRLPLPDDLGEGLTLSPVAARARLTDPDGELVLDEVEAQAGRAGQRVTLRGSVRDLAGDRSLALDGSLELADLRALAPLFELELPARGPLRGSFRLEGGTEAFDLREVTLDLDDPSGLRGHLHGQVDGLPGLVAFTFDAELEAPDLASLAPVPHPELGALGPVRARARLLGAGSQVHVRDLEAHAGRAGDAWLEARGSLDSLAGARNLDLVVSGGLSTTDRLEAFVGRDLPELGPVQGSLRVRGRVDAPALEDLAVEVGREGGVWLVLRGDSLPLPPERLELDVELRAPDLHSLGLPFGRELPAEGPVRASARLRRDPERLSFHDARIRVDRTLIQGGAVRSEDGADRPRFDLELASPELHLDDVGLGDAGLGAGPGWDTPLDLAWLDAADAEAVVRIERVLGREGFRLEAVALRAVLEHGRLRVDPLDLRWQGGELRAEGGVDVGTDPPHWNLRGHGHGIDLATLLAQVGEQDLVSGLALARVDLESRGATGSALLSGLSGDLTLALREGRVGSDYVLLLQADLLRTLALEPFGSRRDAEVRCLVADFALEAGVARARTLLLDGQKVLLVGRGRIDLGRQRFDLVLDPKAKRPGIGLQHAVALKGSFSDPKVRPVPLDLAKDAAKALLGNLLLPGVGTIAPFLHTGTFGRDPCQKALETFLAGD
jgi:uncharacterized protein involved in outer membrane biogenesis